MTRNWKTGLTLAFTGKIYFRILGLGLDTSGLVNTSDRHSNVVAFERVRKRQWKRYLIEDVDNHGSRQ